MRFTHRAHPSKAVRLAYCLNVHPAASLEGVVQGIESITVPLRARLAPGKSFGVGLYLPAAVFEPSTAVADVLPHAREFTSVRRVI